MVPSGSASRQVLIWSVPTLVILLSLVWYKRKRNTLRTDPGGTSDSATKAKADEQTNGHVRQAILLQQPKEEPVCAKKEVRETLPEEPVGEKPVSVEKVVGQETIPEKVEKPCVVEEPVCVKKKLEVKESVLEKGEEEVVKDVCEKVEESIVREQVEKASVVLEEVEEKSVVPEKVKEESVVPEKVEEAPVVAEKVEEKSVVPEKVKEESVVPEKVEEASVVAVVEEESVVAEKLEEESVIPEKVEEESVVPEKVEEESVIAEVEEESVVAEKAEEEPVVAEKLEEESIVAEKVEEESVVAEKLEEESVVAEKPEEESVVAEKVEEESVVAEKVEEESVVAEKVEEESVVAEKVEEPSEESVVAEKVEEPSEESKEISPSEESKEVSPSEESNPAMSEEDTACEGGAVAAVPQEEKVVSLGGKLASLTLEEQRADADRDSANHSPVDAMLASPSLSNYSDEHSEGSSDSGKGCSDVASPPSRTPLGGSSLAGDAEADADAAGDADVRYIVYEFLLPHYLVGRLIGPGGSFVQDIKSKTNATVQVKKHPGTTKQKICVVDGTQSEVDAALAMIRSRYPIRKFPAVTLDQVCILSNVQPTCALIPEYCQLHLVEGVNNEVMVSCMVTPGHMFLQQPYHPTFQYLTRLSLTMNSVYSVTDVPRVPEPITVGSICVAPATEGWYRVQVVSVEEESHSCQVKFVDHGGYMSISNSALRQIHHDFMSVPFQATECYLASIKPAGGSNVWSNEAVRLVDELTRGQMLYAQVYDYTEYSIPLVYLYCCINSLVVLINQELVARGLAVPDEVATAESAATEASALVAAAAEIAPLTRQQSEAPSEVEAV